MKNHNFSWERERGRERETNEWESGYIDRWKKRGIEKVDMLIAIRDYEIEIDRETERKGVISVLGI